jgi:CPA2 family monovalent cation:H+ antiporter-2
LAELGIVLLLFVIGLELTPRRLWQMRNLVFGLGSAQVGLTALVIGGIAYFWGNSPQVSVLLGLSLALSSTAMVVQWLHEQKLFVTHVGRTSFSILLFQDLAVIPVLLLLTILSADMGDNLFSFISFSLLKMVITVLAIYFIGKIILKPLFVFANKHGGSEVFMALSLLVIVASAFIASLAGLSMALGAFIAGLLLADTEYRHEISALVIPFKSMLLGIFFLSFGMSINLAFIGEKPLWLIASVFGLIGIKSIIIFSLCKLWRQSTAVSAESAILLSQAGEFGLLVIASALSVQLMDESVGQFMLITVGMTMLITPVIAVIARKIGQAIEAKNSDNRDVRQNIEEKSQHVVIFGYGRMGSEIGNALSKEGLEVLAFEKDIALVHKARAKLCPVFLGDAAKKTTLEAAQLDNALCVVVTIDDIQSSRLIVNSVRQKNASIPIIVRAHNANEVTLFEQMENVHFVPEHLLVSQKLTEETLKYCGYHEEKASVVPSAST